LPFSQPNVVMELSQGSVFESVGQSTLSDCDFKDKQYNYCVNKQSTKLLQLNIIPLYVLVCVDYSSLTVKGNFEFGHPVVLSYNCVDSECT
jgi:hypothetical protein